MAAVAQFTESDRPGWWEMQSPYANDFLSAFKEQIPSESREWVADEKVWLVAEDYVEAAIACAQKFFEVEVA